MRNLITAITVAAVSLSAGTALAGAEVAESSHKNIRAEWARSQAAGGYGFPLMAVPMAIADALSGKSGQRQISQTQKAGTAGN